MLPRKNECIAIRNAGSCTSRPVITLAACIVALGTTSGALAANECQVRYAYATSFGASATETKNINEGQTIDILSSHGTNILYVENRKNRTIRVYRTGIGQYVDLAADNRDPALGNYPSGTTLQKVSCLTASASSPQPSIQQLVNQAFQSVMQATVPHLNQINNWRTTVENWGKQTASDWGSCPSNGAQNSYNQAKSWRAMIDSSLQQAQQIKANAEAARNSCNATTGNNALCASTYNTLPVHGWITSLTAARSSINAGMSAMAALQCPTGCAQTAQLPVPTVNVQSGGSHTMTIPGMLNLPVCTNVSFGSLGFNPTAVANGQLAQIVQAQAPSCTATTNVRVCTDWDLEGLLGLLKRIKLVPPDVGAIQVDVPSKSITVVTGAAPATCQQPLRVCAPSGNVTISLNEGKNLFGGSASCSNHVTVGCQNPPFGLQPTTQQVSVPDLTKANVRWTRPSIGSIQVDLTAQQFAGLCRGRGRGLALPKPPVISMGTSNVQLPFICTKMNFAKVVANP